MSERVAREWHAWTLTTGIYEVRHYTGRLCPHCDGTGREVTFLLVPMECVSCSGTGKELRLGCRCERCVALWNEEVANVVEF